MAKSFRDDLNGLEAQDNTRTKEMLKPVPCPEQFPILLKHSTVEKSARAMKDPIFRSSINVSFQERVNHVGVYQQAWTLASRSASANLMRSIPNDS